MAQLKFESTYVNRAVMINMSNLDLCPTIVRGSDILLCNQQNQNTHSKTFLCWSQAIWISSGSILMH